MNFVKCLVLLLFFALSGCSYLHNYHVEKAKQECAKFGSMQVIEPVTAEGFLRPGGVPMFSYYVDELATDLTERRYKYIEIPEEFNYEKDKRVSRSSVGLAGKVKGGNGGYFRYFLDDAGSEKCKEFDWSFNLYPTQSYPYLRKKGLPISKCIAGERVEKPLSQYEMVVINPEDGEPFGDYEKHQLQYREVATKKVVAKLSHIQYKFIFSCYKKEEYEKFFNFITAAPNPVLPPKNELVNIYEPQPFRISKTVNAVLESKSISGDVVKIINKNLIMSLPQPHPAKFFWNKALPS